MYGQTIRKIRKSKNITLKEAAGEALSISQLSRFETDKSMIPVDLFYKVLENLNTTTEEFEYLRGQKKHKEIEDIFNRIEDYNNNRKLDKLRHLNTELKENRPTPYSWEQFLIYFIESILNLYEPSEETVEQPVLDYLMQVEDWGEMELRLYAMFGFTLDIETTYFLMRTALKRSQQYLNVPSTANLLYVILSNNFSSFLNADHMDYAEETIELFEKNYAEKAKNIQPHVDFLFNKGVLHFKKKEAEKAIQYCEEALSLCKLFKQKDLEEMFTKRYKNWRDNYENPKFKELTIQVGFYETID